MKKRMLLLGVVLMLFLIVNVSAGVYFSQPNTIYNIGDIIDLQIEVSPLEQKPLEINLVCDSDSGIVFYSPSPQENFNFKFPLTLVHAPYLTGDCYFKAEYLDETYESRTFKISKRLNIELETSSFFSEPGKEIIIKGRAEKLNGLGIDGEVEVNIPLLKLIEHEDADREEFESETKTMAKENWEKDNYELIYNELDNIIYEKENIDSVELQDEYIKSSNFENKDIIILQKIKVAYTNEPEDDEEEEQEITYLKATTTIQTFQIDSQDFNQISESDSLGDYENETQSYSGEMFYGKVNNGTFSVSFSLKEDTPAGDYRIDVLAYEKDGSGERISEGLVMGNLKISQVLTGIEIIIGDMDLNPGETLSFKPKLNDQNNFNIAKDVTVIIKDENSNRIFEKLINSDETIEYLIKTNLTAGYYDIEASNEELNKTKKFYVNEKAIISYKLKNNTLIVTNIGNIVYKKNIQIEFGGSSFIESLNLGLGESKEFKLIGYDGEYEIKVTDGETEFTQAGVALTGNAINVKSIGSATFLALTQPIVWIFFIIVLGAGILFLFRRILKKKSFAYHFKDKFKGFKFGFGKSKVIKLDEKGKPVKEKIEEKEEEKETKKPLETKTKKTHQAEPVLVLKGQKNRATVIAVKIKNKITKESKKGLAVAIEHVYEKRGAVYEQGDYIFVVFSPLMTRSFKNEARAAKAAEKILFALKEHNKKFKDKIEFGIGINSGNILSKFENKKLKFTALGNLIVPAKRLATASNEQILITKQAYERGISEIKAEKRKIKDGEIYEVRRIMDNEKNKAFIQGFLKRMGEEEKK